MICLFLNGVESSSEEDLLVILPKLRNEIIKKRTGSLEKFVVSVPGMPVPEISFDVGEK